MWVAPDDGGSPITDYDYRYRNLTDGGSWTEHQPTDTSTATTVRITGLTNGTLYEFGVRAGNASGDSAWSRATVQAITGTPALVAAPVLSEAGEGRVRVVWTAPADNGAAITGYSLWYREDAGAWTEVTGIPGSATSRELVLSVGETYEIGVEAHNARGGSNVSATEFTGNISSISIAVPLPTLAVTEVRETSATLTIANWTGQWWYRYMTPSGGACSSGPVVGTVAELTNLTSGTDYTVAAYSDGVCSDELASASFSTAMATPSAGKWPVRVARTVAAQVVDAVTGWFETRSSAHSGAHAMLGGYRVDASAQRTDPGALAQLDRAADDPWGRNVDAARMMPAREVLLGSSFQFTAENEAGGPSFGAWGEAATGRFDGEADGEVTTTTLGVDVGKERMLGGVAISRSWGDGSDHADTAPGDMVESTLTGIYPYARVELGKGGSAWSLLGYGTGSLTLTGADGTPVETDQSMMMAAAGGRGTLMPASQGAGFELALKTDAYLVRTDSERVGDLLEETEAEASRLRLLLDASRPMEVNGGTLTPRAEVGLRLDGGDAETGAGVEVGAGAVYAGSGVTVEGAVRGLAAHEESGYEEWGASLSVRIEPGVDGRGLSLAFAPSWGAAGGEPERLWSAPGSLMPDRAFSATRRLDAEVGYGLGAPGTVGVVTPWAGFGLEEKGARSWRGGARWKVSPDALLSLDGTRREPADDAAPEHDLLLRMEMRW